MAKVTHRTEIPKYPPWWVLLIGSVGGLAFFCAMLYMLYQSSLSSYTGLGD